METLAAIFEIVMVLGFGASWPFNIVRAYKARTAKGTSISFTLLIGIGYIGGILSKIFSAVAKGSGYWTNGLEGFLHILAFVFYFINLSMVTAGIVIYFRNKKLDAERDAKEAQAHSPSATAEEVASAK